MILHGKEFGKQMRLSHSKEGPQYNVGYIISPRHITIGTRESQISLIHALKCMVNIGETSTHYYRYNKSNHCSSNHQRPLDNVCHHGTFHTTSHTVENDNDTHSHNAYPFRQSGKYMYNNACSDNLCTHHRNQEEEHHHAQNTAHILGVITICQVISHGQKTIFMTKGNQLAANQKSRKNHTEHSSRYRNSHSCIAYTVNGSRCTKKCSHGKLG